MNLYRDIAFGTLMFADESDLELIDGLYYVSGYPEHQYEEVINVYDQHVYIAWCKQEGLQPNKASSLKIYKEKVEL